MRARLLLSLAVLVALGFYSKYGYRGPGQEWVRGSVGGAFYVAFWSLAVVLIAPRARPALVVLAVVAATCGLEFLQLWHPPALQWARSYFVGRTILGTDFAWEDFPPYFLGAGMGWCWLKVLKGSPVQGNTQA